uniref:Toxin candidate TRINITY_DN40418_c2_g6_i4 n=1 Tax=Pachycerianthus maua TaxID=2736681 RepID=A0A7G7WZ47_9CNID|nr:toxin candidate TRINITY_DN40418_c2_g6_i4 [Pachycerianthus maua]
MKFIALLQFISLFMAVLVSGSDLSDFFSDRLNDKSDDVSRISRGLRQKKIRSSLPLLFSKIISGKHIKEEKKYECKNAKGYDELCGEWKEVCQEDVVLMQTYCKKTCGFCVEKPAPAPPACQLTDHGCCWDGVSTAHGPNQEGCPGKTSISYNVHKLNLLSLS